MKQYSLKISQLGLKAGETFLEMSDGTYKNTNHTVTLNKSIVEDSGSFKQLEDLELWIPTVPNQKFFSVTPDLGVIELGWEENRFAKLWQVGNVMRERSQAEEVANAVAAIMPTYQKKFSEWNKAHAKDPEVIQQTVQQATPPVMPINPNIPPPPNAPPMDPNQRAIVDDPRFSPGGIGNLFRNQPLEQ
jgi:hypothetical protein